MAPWVKALAAKPEDLSAIPRNSISLGEGAKQWSQVVL